MPSWVNRNGRLSKPTVQSCVRFGSDELKVLHDQPQTLVPEDTLAIRRLESEVLLALVLDKNHSWLYTWPEHKVSAAEFEEFRRLLAERNSGQPVAYLTGIQEFWSLNFRVTPDVLVPRADTELLVEVALDRLQQLQSATQIDAQVLELGTGSGAIAVAIASSTQDIAITATDISTAALAIAEQNAQRLLGRVNAIHFIQSDWFEQWDLQTSKAYHLIVSNPPYIRFDDPHLSTPVTGLSFEPQTALVAENDGLQALQTIISGARTRLIEGGWLALEHGHDQAADVRQLFLSAGYLSVESRTDLSGVERVTLGMRPTVP